MSQPLPLTPNEVGKLFDIVKQLKGQGMAIIFISHRLEEIRAIADRVTIFRDGDLITTKKINEVSNEEIIKYMIGRSIEDIDVKENDYLKNNETILSVNNISQYGNFKNISFDLKKGEILGFAGLGWRWKN
jgi:ABC-type sugar transport system ATPase subunit